jgi:hypothetical protein
MRCLLLQREISWDVPTPGLHIDSQQERRWTRSVSRSVSESRPQSLGFVRMEDWDRDASYDAAPSEFIHYRISWRLMINKIVVSRNTIEDIVLEPTSYGPRIRPPLPRRTVEQEGHPPTICTT